MQRQLAHTWANKLYLDPLLRSLNHESKAGFAHMLRQPLQWLGKRLNINSQRSIFGEQTSGPSYIPPEVFARCLLKQLQLTSDATEEISSDLQARLQTLEPLPTALVESLESLAQHAIALHPESAQENQLFEQEISQWFERSMERSQGVYRRNAKLVTLAIALVLAIAANGDTVYLIHQFAQEKVFTAAVLQQVNNLPPNLLEQPEQLLNRETFMILPLGWQTSILQGQQQTSLPFATTWPFFLQRLPGWSITAVAIAMGSGFWYDLLKNLINIRNTGPLSSDRQTD